MKHRLLADGVQIARWDEDDSVKGACFCDVLPRLTGVDAFAISDYDKGSVTQAIIDKLQPLQGTRPIYIHTKGDPTRYLAARFSPPPIMFCNAEEYARYLDAYDHFELVVRTHGEAGAELVGFGETLHHESAPATRVVSVNGAGDSLMAGFIVSHAFAGNTPQGALRHGMAAAAITIERPYTGYIKSWEEVHDRVNSKQ
jgi:bifunctional ADP-heptose synthase (sugar kinase/adenylyltransferase)